MRCLVRNQFTAFAVLFGVWFSWLGACEGDTNNLQQALPSFFQRSQLQSGILEYSRFLSNSANGEDKENVRVLLVFDGDRYFERAQFSQPPDQPKMPKYKIFNGMITIEGLGPPAQDWRIYQQPKAQSDSITRITYVQDEPLFMLDLILFGLGKDGVPFSTAEIASTETAGETSRLSFVSRDKKIKATWWWRQEKGRSVPWKFRATGGDDQLQIEYRYADWKQYAGDFWFPTVTMVQRPESEKKGKAFEEKYVVQKFQPNVRIHSRWFLPQFPENARIRDESLSPSLTDGPLELGK
ncbi:MAG: hypothetical protein PCFJNLEI_03993 [Verrucomicrobiae bacterium]|nr:hypothetical protein [Verrucomicrobiae bacterium]